MLIVELPVSLSLTHTHTHTLSYYILPFLPWFLFTLGIPHPSFTATYCICQRLWTVGVLLVEPTGDLHRRIRAYMNPDDILFALRQDY